MTLGFKQRNAIRKIAEILCNFLPASGHQTWKGHVNFGLVAFKLGLSEYWTGGSKLPAIINLLESTYERKIGIFQNLIETVLLEGKTYRNNKGNPLSRKEVEELNKCLLELGFKFPDLNDPQFLDSLESKHYLLNVIHDTSINLIKLRGGTYINLYKKPENPIWHRQLMLQEWYRARLKARVDHLINKWQDIIGVQINKWTIKQMKTKWGTCHILAKRIWSNLELSKKPEDCLEYIFVHELVHLLEKHHNYNFKARMDKYLPDWRVRKNVLNRFHLAMKSGSIKPLYKTYLCR